MADTATISCPGVPDIRALRFKFGRGVSPSVCHITCVARGDIDIEGPLTLTSNGDPLAFPNMAVAASYPHEAHTGKWPTRTVVLLDRRCHWAGKTISGDWNRRAANGLLDTATTKSPAQLATLILDALGESGYDTSSMPAGVFPRCLWQNERADIALQRLLDYVACDLVLNPLTDRVEIWPLGLGSSAAEDAGEVLPRYRYAPRAYVPSRVVVFCGHSVWQSKLKLQAVARSEYLQQQLLAGWSGLPSGGIANESPVSFPGVTNTTLRTLAFSDYLRTFRVIGQENGSLGVANFPYPITSVEQYVLNDYCLEVETDLDGFKRNIPYYLSGDYWAYGDVGANVSAQVFLGPSRLHPDRRLVELEYPLFKLSSTGAYQEPVLYLTTSYRLRTAEGQFAGLYRFGSVGGGGGDLVLQRPEIFSTYSTSTAPGTQASTEAQAIAEADAYVQLFLRKFQNPFSSSIQYPGMVFLSPDGVKSQVVWEWRVNGAPRTTVYEGEASDLSAPSSRQQRRNMKLEASA